MSGLGHVWLVGAGPGDPGLITATGLAALRRAEVVVYDRLAPPALLAEVPAEALLLDAGKAAGDHAMTQDEINAALVEHGSAGRRVVRLQPSLDGAAFIGLAVTCEHRIHENLIRDWACERQ